MTRAWHFVRRGPDGKPMLRDGRPLVVGEWLEHDGPVQICARGLHASERAFEALEYCEWEGGFVCLVDADAIEVQESNKFACRKRRALFAVEADPILRAFARAAALSVLHHWPDAPAVVREYLETGNEEIRAAAWAAARAAARAAASAAAWDARAAARAAAWDAAWDARAAAWDAARAARAAARAARAAAWDAAGDAAWDAAWDAAKAAAWAAKISELNTLLEKMIMDAARTQGWAEGVAP